MSPVSINKLANKLDTTVFKGDSITKNFTINLNIIN